MTRVAYPASMSQDRTAELAPRLRSGQLTQAERQELWLGHAWLAAESDSEESRETALLAVAAAIVEAPERWVGGDFRSYCADAVRRKLARLKRSHLTPAAS